MSSMNSDILILGGGIAGVSLAYYCAKEGFSVSVLEKNYLASGTSGANQGKSLNSCGRSHWRDLREKEET